MQDNLENLRNLKGTKDFMPEEQLIRNKIMNTLKEVFELYGFLPLETPILCTYDLLASKYAGGSEILKEVYKLTDQGKRELGLRYDLTVPFSKVIATNPELTLPFRRYEIGKVFRDGPVKVGRSREFYQCDVDLCGISGNDIEVEIFDMILEAFKRLNLQVEVIWNNRKFLSGIILEAGIEEGKISSTILTVDKLEKVGMENVEKELMSEGLTKKQITNLFTYFNLTLDQLNKEFASTQNQMLNDGLLEVNNITKLTQGLGISHQTRFVPFLARGLEIYTGTVWEISDTTGTITSSLGGGGRYDNIITKFIDDGKQYPAVGTSFGLEPIYELLKQVNAQAIAQKRVYLFAFERTPQVFAIAKQLRQNGIGVVMEMQNIKLKKALPWAEKNGLNHVVIVGEDELASGTVTYKNLLRSSQETLALNEFIATLKAL